MTIELTKENPWRPGDWRWQRASLLAADEIARNRRLDDPVVVRLERFARAVLVAENPADATSLALREPDIYWAYQLYRQDDPARRSEVEARILGGESREAIAGKTGISVKMLAAYEDAFYDVRDKLPHRSYVLHTLIGTALHRGMQERDYPLIWKYLSFTHGVMVFEAFMHHAIQPTRPTDADGVRACLTDGGRNALLRKQWTAATTVPVNTFTQLDILKVYAEFLKHERDADKDGGGGGASNSIVNNIQAVIQMLPIDVGAFTKPRVDSPVMAKYDASSAELSTPQLMLAVQGRLPEEESEPPKLTYPEPLSHARPEQGS